MGAQHGGHCTMLRGGPSRSARPVRRTLEQKITAEAQRAQRKTSYTLFSVSFASLRFQNSASQARSPPDKAPSSPQPLLPPGGEGEQGAGFPLSPVRERGAGVRGFQARPNAPDAGAKDHRGDAESAEKNELYALLCVLCVSAVLEFCFSGQIPARQSPLSTQMERGRRGASAPSGGEVNRGAAELYLTPASRRSACPLSACGEGAARRVSAERG